MKKFFQIIGLISLTCFSFFVTEKTSLVVSSLDEIMISIKENKDSFYRKPVDSIIEENTIIPGLRKREVNINKSYKNMKTNGYYSDKLYVYDYKDPNISLKNNMDKYIIKGNPEKRMISLIFMVMKNDDVTNILNIVNNYNIKVNFFVEYEWLLNNNDMVENLVYSGHNVGILMDDYTDSDFDAMNTVLKKVYRQSDVFCYAKEENKDNINACKLKDDYTIWPLSISEKTPLSDIKKNIEPGSLLSLKVNSQVERELSTIIIYIRSKGYNINNLKEHILE